VLFSATMGDEVEAFRKKLLRNPVMLRLNEEVATPELIDQLALSG
jgi:superfamily II DNA/RNA helicase